MTTGSSTERFAQPATETTQEAPRPLKWPEPEVDDMGCVDPRLHVVPSFRTPKAGFVR